MNGIVIYKGKYGATEQYARWIGEELSLPVVDSKDIKENDLSYYDFLLIGTSVYIGKLQIQNWLKDNLNYLRGKKIFLFQVAATPPEEKEKRQAYNRASIPEEIMKDCEFYFLPGRMFMQKLSWKDRVMLKMGARLTKDPKAKKGMLTDYDNVRKENIAALLNSVQEFSAISKPIVKQTSTLVPSEI